MKNLSVRKFVPVFQRTKVESVYKYPTGASFERVEKVFPRYVQGQNNFWQVQPTRAVKTMWAIAIAKRTKLGQLKLF